MTGSDTNTIHARAQINTTHLPGYQGQYVEAHTCLKECPRSLRLETSPEACD